MTANNEELVQKIVSGLRKYKWPRAYEDCQVTLAKAETVIREALRSQAGAVPVDADLQCWSCNKPVSFEERGNADGDCPHCRAELDLETYIDGFNDEIRRLKKSHPDPEQPAVAFVDENDEGLFIDIVNGKDGCPVKFGDKLYLHPAAPPSPAADERVCMHGIKNGLMLEPDELRFLMETAGIGDGYDKDDAASVVLWIGETVDMDDDKEIRTYGLNAYNVEVPEEGSVCIRELTNPAALAARKADGNGDGI
jgi:hypothetical protein